MSYTEERTYPELLGRLGEEPSVWAECVFVDPVADIAVLSEPDNQELSEEAEAYGALVEAEAVTPFTIAEPPGKPRAGEIERLRAGLPQDFDQTRIPEWAMHECPGRLLSLDNQWFPCTVQYFGLDGPLMIETPRTASGEACQDRQLLPRTARPSVSCVWVTRPARSGMI
jgi:hypothetical protein